MKFRLSTAACLMVLFVETARAAPPASLFEDFTQHCASHAGDAVAALNAVSQQGWK
jgi:hypothetical protein